MSSKNSVWIENIVNSDRKYDFSRTVALQQQKHIDGAFIIVKLLNINKHIFSVAVDLAHFIVIISQLSLPKDVKSRITR